jgi:hypothetical protein
MNGLMENAAVVGIHIKRGFPQLLGKVPQIAAGLFHISHRPDCHALFRDDRRYFGLDHNIWWPRTQNPEAPFYYFSQITREKTVDIFRNV